MSKAIKMVIVDKAGLVHDLGGGVCPAMSNLRLEFSEGRECYTEVKPLQVRVWKLLGCPTCFGTPYAFQEAIRASL